MDELAHIDNADQLKQYAAAEPEQAYRQAGLVTGFARKGGKLLALCPFHEETDPSFKVTLTGDHAGKWYCHGACKEGGSIVDFVKRRENLPTNREAIERTAELLGPTEAPPPAKKKALPRKRAQTYHDILLAEKNQKHLDRFMIARGLSLDIIKQVQIGHDGDRFTIPVYDHAGKLLDIRHYKLDAPNGEKMLAEKGHGQTHIYGWQWLADDDELVLCEGELDCLALLDRGIPSFSATNGAGKWPDDPPDLTGKTIHICGDADEAGQQMNRILPDALYSAGAEQVFVVEWPPDAAKGYDVTDYFLDGGTAESFRALLGKAKVATARRPRRTSWTGTELAAAEFPEPRWLVPDLIPEGFTFLGGRPKVKKGFFALQLAFALATGGKCLGHDCPQGRVLMILLEEGERRIKARIGPNQQDWTATALANVDFEFAWPLGGDGGIEALRARLEETDYLLCAIDTFTRFVGGIDQDSVGDVSELLGTVQEIGLDTNTSLLVNDHHNKAKSTDPVDALLGSTAKAGIPDTILGIYRMVGTGRPMLRGRGRDIEDLEMPMDFDLRTFCWHPVGDEHGVTIDTLQGRILDAIREAGGVGYVTELAKLLDTQKSNVSGEIVKLINKGALVKGPPEKGNRQPYMLPGGTLI